MGHDGSRHVFQALTFFFFLKKFLTRVSTLLSHIRRHHVFQWLSDKGLDMVAMPSCPSTVLTRRLECPMRGCPAEDFFALGAPPLTVPHQASVFLSVKEYTGDGPHAPLPCQPKSVRDGILWTNLFSSRFNISVLCVL